ncbi:MAG: hypothetical protein NT041_01545 [Candidatus Vogelbacteria bacterium]|nr:hypothetical protein [Candidatus Vogelbacteria bacterium]
MKNNHQSGLAKLAILIVVAIIIISYLGINIQKIAESDTGRANFGYVWQIILQVWDWLTGLYQQYLAGPIGGVWGTVFTGQGLPNWLTSLKIPFLSK